MKRKALLSLPIPPCPENQMQDYSTVEYIRGWDQCIEVINVPNYIYTVQIDSSTGEQVLILDLYRPEGKHIYRLFTKKDKWFRKWDGGKLSEAGMDHTMFPEPEWQKKGEKRGADRADEIIRKYTGIGSPKGLYAIAELHRRVKTQNLNERYNKIHRLTCLDMRVIREVPKGVQEWICTGLMKQYRYLFAEYGKGKTMQAVCSHCGQNVTIPHVKEGSSQRCPHCRSKCEVRSMRKHVQNNGFWKDANFEYLQSTPEGYVARVFYVCWHWKRGEAKASQMLNEEERWFYAYDAIQDDFKLRVGYRYETFYASGKLDWCRYGYDSPQRMTLYPGNLDKLFRRASGFKAYHVRIGEIARKCPRFMIQHLYHAVQNVKVLQNCVDAGLYRLASDLIDMTHRKDKEKAEIIDDRYGSLRKALGIGKDDLPFLRSVNPDAKEVRLYCRLRAERRPLEPQSFRMLCDDITPRTQRELLSLPLTVYAEMRYISEQHKKMNHASWNNTLCATATDWMDYIHNARLLQYNLTDRAVMMPRNLKHAHDAAMEIVNSIDEKNGYRFSQIAEQEEQYNRLYATANHTLFIRAPHNHQEIIEEGKDLQHCVATYAKRIAAGETVILFVRRRKEPDEPYYTLNINPKDGHMIQCRGLRNCGMTDDVKNIVNMLLDRLSGRKETA